MSGTVVKMDLASAGPIVLHTLTNACSQNADVLKPAVHQLKQWETSPGFYTILSTIFQNHEIDFNIRWLAVLYFKNGIERYWRRNAPNAIAEEEKNALKKRLIDNFNEPVPQVATQLAVLIGKIARMDCPRYWPELIPTLLMVVRCNDRLLQERSLLVLHHVIKSLASKRLMADRKLFEEVADNLFSFVLNLWNTHMETFLQLASKYEDGLLESLDKSILGLKVLRKLVCFGFKDQQLPTDVIVFINMIFSRLDPFLECRRNLWGNQQMVEKCEKLILLMTKVLIDMLEVHPLSFVQFIPTTLQFVARYNFVDTGESLHFPHFTVNCLNMLKIIVHTDSYKVDTRKEKINPASVEAHKLKMETLTPSTLTEVCCYLINRYFLLSPEDLQTWESDPESFCQDEGGDSYKFSLKPCTEVLFLSLFKNFHSTLAPVLLDMVQNVQGPCGVDDMAAILRKDAVYNAVGLASFDLFDDIDFDQWFTSHLIPELQNKHTNYRIIRRRVIWLVSQWVGVKLSVSLRATLYETILPLLQEKEDLVVRLEAANTLRTAVDDFEFNTEQFLPYLSPSFSLLFQLLREIKECDTKMHVLYVISFVIERVGAQIRPYADQLILYLPLLWDSDHNMLRCAILTTLIRLVKGLGTSCNTLYDFLIPVIRLSTDVTQQFHVYLKEDGLDLWLETLHNSPVMTPGLLDLFTAMPAILEFGNEDLKVCLKIVEAYVVLGQKEFMQRFSQDIVMSFSSLITDIRTDGILLILKAVELIFQSFPLEAPQVFQPLLSHIFKTTLENNELVTVLSMQLYILGRVLLQNQEYFWSFLAQESAKMDKESRTLLGMLLDLWFEKMDSITKPEHRKLSALALSSLLTMNLSPITERFSGILNVCVEVLHDICRADCDTGKQTDCLVIGEEEDAESTEENTDTEHEKRKQMLLRHDPVHAVSLKEFVVSQLTICQQLHGQLLFDQLMANVDKDILIQLQELTS
ncbi:importin-11 isoform X2 [Octopus vulgaris]|uniref:Importin-11 isoform X2 n=2 Tax=Octopus TaxID=6643 RepID=A0AA36BD34_OCTVU|nr:importin-11 isoform X2 [Octopus sinensis]CAI9731381.1 importin-11 isoform X2 [Octopus vulgaris]